MARKPAKPAPEAKPETPTATDPAPTNSAPTDPATAAETSLAAVLSGAEADTKPAEPKAPAADAPGALIVTGPKRGRWRAGWHFGPEPRRLPLAEMTEDERAAIESDPTLVVSVEAETSTD